MKVNFFNEEIPFKVKSPAILRKWVTDVVQAEQLQLKEVNYIFCNDNYLYEMNVKYLNHDTLTDIITFDNSDDTETIEGDIFISVERVKENAENLSLSFESELHRVMIHGILHLCGYGDKSAEQKIEMRKKEDACLSLLSE